MTPASYRAEQCPNCRSPTPLRSSHRVHALQFGSTVSLNGMRHDTPVGAHLGAPAARGRRPLDHAQAPARARRFREPRFLAGEAEGQEHDLALVNLVIPARRAA